MLKLFFIDNNFILISKYSVEKVKDSAGQEPPACQQLKHALDLYCCANYEHNCLSCTQDFSQEQEIKEYKKM